MTGDDEMVRLMISLEAARVLLESAISPTREWSEHYLEFEAGNPPRLLCPACGADYAEAEKSNELFIHPNVTAYVRGFALARGISEAEALEAVKRSGVLVQCKPEECKPKPLDDLMHPTPARYESIACSWEAQQATTVRERQGGLVYSCLCRECLGARNAWRAGMRPGNGINIVEPQAQRLIALAAWSFDEKSGQDVQDEWAELDPDRPTPPDPVQALVAPPGSGKTRWRRWSEVKAEQQARQPPAEPERLHPGDILGEPGKLRMVNSVDHTERTYTTERLVEETFDTTHDGGFKGRYRPRSVPDGWQERK